MTDYLTQASSEYFYDYTNHMSNEGRDQLYKEIDSSEEGETLYIGHVPFKKGAIDEYGQFEMEVVTQ